MYVGLRSEQGQTVLAPHLTDRVPGAGEILSWRAGGSSSRPRQPERAGGGSGDPDHTEWVVMLTVARERDERRTELTPVTD
jgi:hypothetical protein